jgi:hypothetical protein
MHAAPFLPLVRGATTTIASAFTAFARALTAPMMRNQHDQLGGDRAGLERHDRVRVRKDEQRADRRGARKLVRGRGEQRRVERKAHERDTERGKVRARDGRRVIGGDATAIDRGCGRVQRVLRSANT